MNSKGHLYCSLAKSIIRVIGCVPTIFSIRFLGFTILCLILAELLGILEELLDNR